MAAGSSILDSVYGSYTSAGAGAASFAVAILGCFAVSLDLLFDPLLLSPESESGVKLGRRVDAGSVLHRYSPIPPPSASDCFTRAAQESETSKTTPTLSEFIASHLRNKSTRMLSTIRISVPNMPFANWC